MIRNNLIRSLALLSVAGAFAASEISAQVCDATSLSGAYGFVAAQAGGASMTTTSTSGSSTQGSTPAGTYSGTAIGQLLAGLTGTGPFSVTGRLVFDGAGNIASSSSAGAANAAVGTYTVNPDCSVSMALADPFGSNTSVNTDLAGVIANRGAEVDLGLAQQTSTTGSTTTTGSASGTTTTGSTTTSSTGSIIQSGPGVTIRLDRLLYSSGCSATNLSGAYAFVANGVATTESSSTATTTSESAAKEALARTAVPLQAPGTTGLMVTGPLTILGSMRFDGAGNISPNPSYSQLPLSFLQVTGTYTVNSDCTGNMTLNTSTPTSADFVLVQSTPPAVSGSSAQGPAEILLNIFSSTSVVSGSALPQ